MKFRAALLVLSLASLTGCGSSDTLKVVPIAGVVKYNGSPVPNADIIFFPDKGPAGNAKTDSAGAFQIKTNGKPGGAPGKGKMTVVAPQSSAIPPSDGRALEFVNKSTVPAKYSSETTTDLLVDIASGGNRDLNLELKD